MKSTSRRSAGLALSIFIMVVAAAGTPGHALAQSGREVWAFYMGYWTGQSSWDAQASVLTDYPQIGAYSSHDAGVAGLQIEEAQSAEIDAFIISWFGPDDIWVTQPTLNNMLARASERGFRIGVAVDMFNGDFGEQRVRDALRYLMATTIHHPAYLRYHGKPVIFFAFQSASGFSVDQWLSIRSEIDPAHDTIWVAEGLLGCCIYGGAMDGMYAFNLAWSDGSATRITRERDAVYVAGGTFYAPTVHPGWDETLIAQRDGRTNPTSPRPRNGGAFLTAMWNAALAANTDVILAVSWNEYLENHHIEPSVQYGTQALDTLRPLVQSWESGTVAQASSTFTPVPVITPTTTIAPQPVPVLTATPSPTMTLPAATHTPSTAPIVSPTPTATGDALPTPTGTNAVSEGTSVAEAATEQPEESIDSDENRADSQGEETTANVPQIIEELLPAITVGLFVLAAILWTIGGALLIRLRRRG